jgi:hypothetical protein
MKGIDTAVKSDGKTKSKVTRQFHEISAVQKDQKSRGRSMEITRIHPSAVIVPAYTSYVGLEISVLTESDNKLLIHPSPFFPEDKEAQLSRDLPAIYRTNFERRSQKLLHDHMAQQYRPDAEELLEKLGIDEHDILQWILEKKPLAPGPEREALRLLLEGAGARLSQPHPNNDYSYSKPAPSDLRNYLMNELKPSNAKAKAYAALLCLAIDSQMDQATEFDSWELFRRGRVVNDVLRKRDSANASDSIKDFVKQPEAITQRRHLMCRVCNL